MKNPWVLIIYPALAVLFLLVGFNLYRDWFWLGFFGDRADASINAMFLDKGDGTAELLNRIELDMELQCENGSILRVRAIDFTITSLVDDGVVLNLSEGVAAALGSDQSLATDLEELVQDAADRTEWFMLRQSRLTDPSRFVRVEKREQAFIYRELPETLQEFVLHESGKVLPDLAEYPGVSTVTTEAIFSYEDQEALRERKGKHLSSYTRSIDGEAVDNIHSEMLIHNEPYATIQYPVFVYAVGGEVFIRKADLGKHGDPFLAFPYRGVAKALYDPQTPDFAMLVGKATPPEPGEKFLNWFSRVSEIYMTRWVYPFMFGLLAFVCAFVGLIFISMMTHPPKRLPPIPEEKKQEDAEESEAA